MSTTFLIRWLQPAALLAVLSAVAAGTKPEVKLLNVSYDVTREFYADVNPAFAGEWKSKTGESVVISQSHGGSSKQARAVLDGLEADVVTMNQPLDIEILQSRGHLIPTNWASRLPGGSVPYHSTILFVVRPGNPKQIRDWSDLIRPGVSVVIPNPKTSGNGRYSYLGAWGYAVKQSGGDEVKARDFLARLFANVPVLDAGGRAATTTFVQHQVGDVLLTFENEAFLIAKDSGNPRLEIVVPSASIRADNPVVWVDANVARHGTEEAARAYLEFLFTDAGQELAARHGFRPREAAVLARHGDQFKPVPLFSVEEIAGSWDQAQHKHFDDGGLFDQLYQPRK
ncbi:MAG: sulfate ABC transporter substrate-binding protein [Verrucomicrobiota bacterium]